MDSECVSNMVSRRRLRWFGHVERNNADDWVSACRKLEVAMKGKEVEEEVENRGRSVWQMT